jgi:hypothetical protein
MRTVGCVGFSPLSYGAERSFPHQACYPFSATANALLFQLCVETGAPIDIPIFMKRIFNTLGEMHIILLSLTHASFSPVKVSIL